MGRSCSQNGGKQNAFKILTGKPIQKRSLGRPRRGWEDTIRMDLKEINMDRNIWTGQELLSSCEFGNEPLGPMKHEVCQLICNVLNNINIF